MRWLPGSLAAQLSPPVRGAKPNWASPSLSGLIAVIDPFTGDDLLTKTAAAVITGTRIGASGIGEARGYGATRGAGSTDRVFTQFSRQPATWTIAFRAVCNSLGSTAGRVFSKGSEAASAASLTVFAQTTPYNPGLAVFVTNSGGAVLCDRAFQMPAFGTPLSVVITFGGTAATTKMWINGSPCAAQNVSTGVSVDLANQTSRWIIGNRGDSLRNWDGHIGHLFVWGGELPEPAAQAISADFDSLYAVGASPLWAPTVASVTVYRPGSDIIVNGWTAVGAASLAATMADASDATYAQSPNLSDPTTQAWDNPLPAGTWDIEVRADRTGATGQVRIVCLDGGGTPVGTSSWQTLTGAATSYTLSVTTSATAPNFRIEVQ